MTITITEFIKARVDELEAAAMAASGVEGHPAAVAEHWRWECTRDDVPLDLDTDVYDGAAGRMLFHCNDWRTGLRSTEAYQETRVSVHDEALPHMVIGTDEPVRPEDARHILLHDPDRAARMVRGIRDLMAMISSMERATAIMPLAAEMLRRPVAEIWDYHPDYQAGWRLAR
jgi:hypothetical protein